MKYIRVTTSEGRPVGTLAVGDRVVTARYHRQRQVYVLDIQEMFQLVVDRAAKQQAAAAGIPVPKPRRGR